MNARNMLRAACVGWMAGMTPAWWCGRYIGGCLRGRKSVFDMLTLMPAALLLGAMFAVAGLLVVAPLQMAVQAWSYRREPALLPWTVLKDEILYGRI